MHRRNLTVLKKLVTGQLSLVVTFWVWGILGGFLIGLIGASGVKAGHTLIVPLTYLIKTAFFCAVLSGITFILRRKITVLGVIAFFIILVQVILGIIMAVGISYVLLK